MGERGAPHWLINESTVLRTLETRRWKGFGWAGRWSRASSAAPSRCPGFGTYHESEACCTTFAVLKTLPLFAALRT